MKASLQNTSFKYSIPESFAQELFQGNVVAFVGAGLSIGAGLPTWRELIEYLSDQSGVRIYEKDPLKAAQYFENKFGRSFIIKNLKNVIKIRNLKPIENHFLLANFPISVFITTNYDDLIEKSLNAIGKPFHRIILDKGIAYWNEKEEIQLIKMHGSIDDEETIIFTESDYLNNFDKHKAITLKIKDLLMYRTFMFIGYSLSDYDFNSIYSEIATIMERHHRFSYLIDFDVNTQKRIECEKKGIIVIDIKDKEDEKYFEKLDDTNKIYFYSKRLNDFLHQLNIICRDFVSVTYNPRLKSDEEIKLSGFLEELIIDFERDTELKNYVKLKCESYDEYYENFLDNKIKDWIYQEDNNIFVLLGDYGTGKTMFCRKLAFDLAKKYLRNPINNKIPLLIYLREFTKASGIESVIDNALKKYNISYNEFAKLASEGKFLIILDAFDEMSLHLRKQISFENIIELSKLFNKKCKILITSRTHYFKRRLDEEKIFSVTDDNFTGIRLKEQKVPVSINYLKYFNSDDVNTYLKYKFGNSWSFYANKIYEIYDLEDLAKRPILLNLISQTLPELSNYRGDIQQHQLYSLYIDLWLSREEWRGIEKSDVIQFLENLSFRMFELSEFSLNFERLEQTVKEHFKNKILSHIDLEDFDGKIRTCSFLNRDSDGNYSFMHRSFIEYFVAKKYSRQIKNKLRDDFGRKKISPEIALFVSNLTSLEERKILFDWIEFTSTELYINADYLGANSITILGIAKENLKNKNFSGAFLKESYLIDVDLSNTYFDYAILDDSMLDSSNLTNASLYGASIQNSSLVKAILSNAILQADFSYSNLTDAIITEADLTNGIFCFANLERANLWGALLNSSCFCGATLKDTILDHANLQDCDLFKANLSGSSLKYSNLVNINIESTDLSNCDIDGTFLQPEICLEDRYDEDSHGYWEDEEYEEFMELELFYEESYDDKNFIYKVKEDLIHIPSDSELESYNYYIKKYVDEDFDLEKEEEFLTIQDARHWLNQIAMELFWEWEEFYDLDWKDEYYDYDFDDDYDYSDHDYDEKLEKAKKRQYKEYFGEEIEDYEDEYEIFHSWIPRREYKPKIKKFNKS